VINILLDIIILKKRLIFFSLKIEFGTLFTRGDDNYASVAINFNFKYFAQSYSQLILSTNGFVNFVTNSATSGNSISALYFDLDTRRSGGIYYQNLNSQSSDFTSIKSDINRLNATFVPTNLFRITYSNVPHYTYSSYLASFQIILASDASKSYVLLKYTSCLTGLSLSTVHALYYLASNGQQLLNPISVNPCTGSNVNLVGTWVFDVSLVNSKQFKHLFFFQILPFHCNLFVNPRNILVTKTSVGTYLELGPTIVQSRFKL
jgi:hypothetical protein